MTLARRSARTVLLTGFSPFAGDTLNSSLEAVWRLRGERIGGAELAFRRLPCTFQGAFDGVAAAIRQLKPVVVVCVGQAEGRSDVSVERVAINVDDSARPDNSGRRARDRPIVRGGPAAYWSTLPIKRIVAAIREAGIPASVSNSAGTYVCNHVFYRLGHLLATEAPGIRGGFVHLPLLPAQVERHAGKPSMSLETAVGALRIAVATCLQREPRMRR